MCTYVTHKNVLPSGEYTKLSNIWCYRGYFIMVSWRNTDVSFSTCI